jgi:hypothetical protein
MTQSQPRQRVLKTLSPKNPSQKRAGGVTQDVGPEFKFWYCKKKKKEKKRKLGLLGRLLNQVTSKMDDLLEFITGQCCLYIYIHIYM